METSNGGYLPMEMAMEVLARLPVKSLLRFRCVCKSWYSLISSPEFASLHLACRRNDGDDLIILAYPHPRVRTNRGWMFHYSHAYKKFTRVDDHIVDYPIREYFYYGFSVNGLFLKVSFHGRLNRTRNILLWNPAVRKTYHLPPLSLANTAYFGLGFDSSNNDYKVVAITNDREISIQIYSIKSNTWKRIDKYQGTIIRRINSDGVWNDGNIYWASEKYLVSLNVTNETFNYMRLPRELVGGYRCKPIVYRESVGLLGLYRGYLCKLWMMEKNQVQQCWFKAGPRKIAVDDRYHIMGLTKNGPLIVILPANRNNGEVKLYDFESGKAEHLMRTDDLYPLHYSSPYKESLVLL